MRKYVLKVSYNADVYRAIVVARVVSKRMGRVVPATLLYGPVTAPSHGTCSNSEIK